MTDKHDKRGIVLLDDNLINLIERYRADGYQRDKRVPSRSEAIRELVIEALKSKGYQVDNIINTPISTKKENIDKKPAQTTPAPASKPTPIRKHDWLALWSEYQALKAQNPSLTEAEFGRTKGIGKEFLNKRFRQFKYPANPTTLPPTVATAKAD
jgi:hypothetical protein